MPRSNPFSRLAITLVMGVAVAASLSAAVATTYYVGTCGGGPSVATITAAVNASSSGGTVYICPGTYPEQVVIDKNLTVTGLSSGNADQVVITSPAGGVVINATDLANPLPPNAVAVAAQVLVQNANVSLSKVTVDGSNNRISGCSPDLRGIYFQDAGGSISDVVTRNQVLSASLIGCQSGQGIFVQSGYNTSVKRTVTIQNNSVHAFQKNGITADGAVLTVTISNNYIVGQGPTTGAAENGVQVSSGAAGKVANNTVIDEIWAPDTSQDTGDAAAGILIYASQGIEINGNTVGSTQFGIVTVSSAANPSPANPSGLADNANIHDNQILGTQIFDGIDVCSNSNTVKSNAIFSSTESGIHLDSTCGGTGQNSTVSSNTINEGCAAILQGNPTDTISGNSYFNVVSQVVMGDVCPAAGNSTASFTGHAVTNSATGLNSRRRPLPAL